MKKIIVVVVLTVTTYIFCSSFNDSLINTADEIPFPEGYRNWTHVKTYIVRPKNPAFKFIGGFNHVYANEEAMTGYKTGHFPNGSMIVSDVISANEDSLNTREGDRVHVDVMARDSTKYDDFGGWRFETFDKSSKTIRLLTPATRTQCTNCHKKNSNMVYSEYRN